MGTREQVQQFLRQSQYRDYADEILDLIKPSIRIRTHSDRSLSRSHFGGKPEIPLGFEMPTWDITPHLQSRLQYFQQDGLDPHWQNTEIAKIQKRLEGNTLVPLTYLGQIVLNELPELDGTTNLPRTGILYFFYDLVNFPPGCLYSSKGGWRSIYLNISPDEIEEFTNYGETHDISPHRSLMFELEWMFAVPEYKVNDLEYINDQNFTEIYRELQERFLIQPIYGGSFGGQHQLLGYPGIIQDEMERMCQFTFHGIDEYWEQSEEIEEIEDGVKDWQLLAQIDSDDNLGWDFDYGRLFFWIRQQELERQDFSNVWCEFQCT